MNEALFLMVEKDFDYYFVDADVEHSQAFIKHIEHDPQLAPPLAVVLLTDNEEEDCEAWSADTFITKSKIYDDLPYVFSHLKGRRFKQADIVSIAPDRVKKSDKTSCEDIPRESIRKERPNSERPEDEKDRHQEPTGLLALNREHSTGKKELSKSGSGSGRRLRLAAVALLLVMSALWLFVWGPFANNEARRPARKTDHKNVEAETADSEKVNSEIVDTRESQGSAAVVQPKGLPPLDNAPAEPSQYAPDSQPVKVAPHSLPPTEPVNHAPTASISGPQQINARETATYTAVASDSDGDSLSYSWGSSSKSMAWSVPGLYSVSVTVTDSHGASSSASMSVRVI